jgi:hypothetical protein
MKSQQELSQWVFCSVNVRILSSDVPSYVMPRRWFRFQHKTHLYTTVSRFVPPQQDVSSGNGKRGPFLLFSFLQTSLLSFVLAYSPFFLSFQFSRAERRSWEVSTPDEYLKVPGTVLGRVAGYPDSGFPWFSKEATTYTFPINSLSPFHPSLYNLYQGWRTFFRAGAQIFDYFRRNSFACPWEFWAAKWGLSSSYCY